MNRLVTVKCPICGRIIKTRGKYFFRCCGIGMPINKYIITENICLKNEQKNGKNDQNDDKIRIILKETGDNYEK